VTLNLYIARRFLGTVGKVFLIFFAILMLIDMIEQLRRFSDAGIGLAGAAQLSLYSVPETLYRILPLIMVMGAIANFLGLARSSELVVVRAAGRSGLHFLMTPLLVSVACWRWRSSILWSPQPPKPMTTNAPRSVRAAGRCCRWPIPAFGCGKGPRPGRR
jgi:Lipopolysaccharide export system permease LptF/LptG